MKSRNVEIGRNGELLAERYLGDNGYTVVERRFRAVQGEIDLIATKENLVIFVEVKTRRSKRFGTPGEAVTSKKQKTIAAVAEQFLIENDWTERPVRFDVIEVYANEHRIYHICDAFFACMD